VIRLDLGAGPVSPLATRRRQRPRSPIFPLPMPTGASTKSAPAMCWSTFPTTAPPKVLADWVRALKPGGVLRIAVPDFAKVAAGYLEGAHQPTEAGSWAARRRRTISTAPCSTRPS